MPHRSRRGDGLQRVRRNPFAFLHACALCALGLLHPAAFAADAYAQRPIRMIVPFVPGGAADIIARMLGAKLAETLGQQVVIDTRPGAGSVLGTELAAKAGADGYTLVLVATAHAFLQNEIATWTKVIRQADIRPNR